MRKRLTCLSEAQKIYGVEKTTFERPRFVDEEKCEWCGQPITNKRRTSCCCEECSRKFLDAISPVRYANVGSVGGYRGHILRRDRFTCQICGELHVMYSEFDLPLPTTDGQLDVHHKVRVCDGGDDSPDNLITLCRECHKKLHSNE